jgi:hypothetical protein
MPPKEEAASPAEGPEASAATPPPEGSVNDGTHTVNVDGSDVQLSDDQLQEYVRGGMRLSQERKALEKRAQKLSTSEDDMDRFRGFQSMLANDPGQAVEMVKRFAQESGWQGQEEGSGGPDLDDMDPEIRGVMQRVQRLEAASSQREKLWNRQRMESQLQDVTQGFDLYKSPDDAKLFQALVAAGVAQNPGATVEQVAHLTDSGMRRFLDNAMTRMRQSREESDDHHRGPGPGIGTPDLTPPDEPFTQADMKSGKIKERFTELLKSAERAAGGPT